MLQQRSIQSSLNFRDKLLSVDYILVISILILGLVSMLAMYSTDGGEFKYHTNSHILGSLFFWNVFCSIIYSDKIWHSTSYLIYFDFSFITRCKYFGLTSSGSKVVRSLLYGSSTFWLMRVGLILLAKYYHRISIENINNFRHLIFITVLIGPIILVAAQPDLGTSILIASGGIIVAWLAGYELIFIYSGLAMIALLPIAISFLETLSKITNINFFKSRKRSSWGRLSNYSIPNSYWLWGLFGKGFKRLAELLRLPA